MASELIDDPSAQEADEEYIFNEYSIDDTLDPLSRLVRYHQSDFSLQRLVLVRELCETARFAGYQESAKVIVPLLAHLTQDSEPAVRQALVDQLFPLAELFVEQGGDAGYEHLLNTFLPMGFELLVDKNIEVGTNALNAIQKLAKLVHKEHVQTHLLNVVITLARDERAEDYRVVAAQLFNDLAPIFGGQLCTALVLPELELLCNDSSFSVRRTVASFLGGICQSLDQPSAQQVVLDLYLTLCCDDIWGVRQACAESVWQVAEALPESARVQHLVPVLEKLLADESRWVRSQAHKSFGYLLHTLSKDDISPELLQLFTDMAFQSDNAEGAFSAYCAFCFPAVVEVTGPSRWAEMADSYATMLKDVQWKVRKSLAYSLHELAIILGSQKTEESIVPAFELLLRDLDDIKLGVVLSVEKFLSVLRPATRDKLVPLICHVPLESENWRLRNEVAKRMGEVGLLLEPSSQSFPSVLALVSRLLDDSVMEVRMSTYKPVAVILKHLSTSNTADYHEFLRTILELATRPSFQGRQMFAYVAEQAAIVGADDILEHSLLDGMVQLARDRVDNVRLVVQSVVERTFLPHQKWGTNAKVQEVMRQLQLASTQQQEHEQEQLQLQQQQFHIESGAPAAALGSGDGLAGTPGGGGPVQQPGGTGGVGDEATNVSPAALAGGDAAAVADGQI